MISILSHSCNYSVCLKVSERDGEEYAIPTGPFDYVDPMTFNKGPIANDKESNEILEELGLPPLATRKRKKKAKKGGDGESGDEEDDSDSNEDSDAPVAKVPRKIKTQKVSGRPRKKAVAQTEVPLADLKGSDIILVNFMSHIFERPIVHILFITYIIIA